MANKETSGRWPCPIECENIPLGIIAAVMNECGISIEEYMADRKKYLIKCGVLQEEEG